VCDRLDGVQPIGFAISIPLPIRRSLPESGGDWSLGTDPSSGMPAATDRGLPVGKATGGRSHDRLGERHRRKACGRLRRRGEALLRHSFRALFLRGKRGCDLLVDAESLTGATRLYDRVGMSAHPRFAIWEKELHPASQATDT
jgi:hypothetical protein